MNKIYALFTLLFSIAALAQQTPKPYFQQEVNYDIQVTLNDIDHTLEGIIEMEYTNNSKENLDFIYMHLWPNAYKNTETAFAKQQVENGDTDFYYSRPSERGNISDLAFTVNDETAKYKEEATDYGKLMLNEPLKAGETITIKTPFTVKIPNSFSRLGHVDQSYQITQWYPKPAVYDREGWHPMSYLDQGEFYSEYGCFDVKITLPKNYIVGATGDLQNEEEIAFLNAKAEETKAISTFEDIDKPVFPESSPVFKTLEYKQCNVHDFAWFADKRFHVLKGEATMPESGRKVDLWTMFTDTESELWANSIEYVHDGLVFYSEKVGEYPFNQCTAVQSALSAGAGMEYPQVTVIGLSGNAEALEDVIVHEVGHNWFQGQLGSNERDYPFLDEGYNTYYDQRYKREKYPNKKFKIPSSLNKLINPSELAARDVWELGYNVQAHQCKDQACGLRSEDFTATNYGLMVYTKTGIILDYLAAYLGQAEFDRIMKSVYERWEFKHPQPEDFERVFSQLSLKNLDWFFEDLIKTNKKVDYQLWNVEKSAETIGNSDFHKVMVLNHPNNVAGPFSIAAIKDGEKVDKVWYDGFHGNEKVLFPAVEYDKLVIDFDHQLPEYNRKNNTIKAKGLLKKVEPLKLQFFGNLENPDKTQIFLAPAMGINIYDGFQLGLMTHSGFVPSTKFEYTLAGMYGFKSKAMTGMGEVAYNLRPEKGLFARIRPAVNFATFGDGDYKIQERTSVVEGGETSTVLVPLENADYRYFRFTPEVKFDFRKKSLRSKAQHSLTLKHINIRRNSDANNFNYQTDKEYSITHAGTDTLVKNNYFNQIIYEFSNNRTILPYGFGAKIEQQSNFVKASVQANVKLKYPAKNKGISLRLFAGAFIWENDIFYESIDYRDNSLYQFGLNNVGKLDYAYEDLWVGRQESSGFWGQQVGNNNFNGGFNTSTGFKNDTYGTNEILADKWLVTLNVEVESPLSIPILSTTALYINMGVNNRSISGEPQRIGQATIENFEISANLYQDKILYETGVAFKIIPNIFEVYFPLLISKDLQINDRMPYGKRISFMLNLNRLNLIKQARNIDL